ncbi:MAG: endonuclease/exonuclease/phosphatase family protein [Deltaproteobacteria bacterium]|nr:endonuclease/exonuclease/phosphatase family protein [Deltaproteobacteria bacterium]
MHRGACLIVVVVVVAGCAGPQLARAPEPEEASARLFSWNVNFGLAGDPAALELIANSGADVVLLQETNEEWERAIRGRLRTVYPHMEFHHCCRAGGLAVLSKGKIVDVEVLPAVSWFPALRAVVDTPIGPVETLNVHLRPPFGDDGGVVSGWFETPAVREQEMLAFATALEEHTGSVVVGDFNEDEGRAISALQERGYVDALPLFWPEQPTWHWPIAGVDVKLRLDHVFVRAGRLEVIDVHVEEAGGSDHFPMVAVLILAEDDDDGDATAAAARRGPTSSSSLSWRSHR